MSGRSRPRLISLQSGHSGSGFGKHRQELVPAAPRLEAYSSRHNQIELSFAKIERDVITRCVFISVPDIEKKLMRHIRHYIKSPRTVNWNYADPSTSTAALIHAVASPLKASALGAQILLAFLWGQRFGRVAIGGRVAPGCRRARRPGDGRIRIDRCSRDRRGGLRSVQGRLLRSPCLTFLLVARLLLSALAILGVSVQLGDSS
jgi:hypothetical protein